MGIFYARKLKFSVLLTQTIKLQPYARVASGPCPRWSWGSKGQAILCTLDTCPVCSKFFKSSYLNNLLSESIHLWIIGILDGRLSFHDKDSRVYTPGWG